MPGISKKAWQRWWFERRTHPWTRWSNLTADLVAAELPDAGCYVLACPSWRPVERLLDTDPHGLLDIGESGNLGRRLRELFRCITKPEATGHMAGWRIGTLGLLSELKVDVSELRLSWCILPSKGAAELEEGRIMKIYFDRFGELPPVNYKANWKHLAE